MKNAVKVSGLRVIRIFRYDAVEIALHVVVILKNQIVLGEFQ